MQTGLLCLTGFLASAGRPEVVVARQSEPFLMTVKPGEGGGNMQHAYTSDPLANLTREQATLVMGGTFRRTSSAPRALHLTLLQANNFSGPNRTALRALTRLSGRAQLPPRRLLDDLPAQRQRARRQHCAYTPTQGALPPV